MRILMVHPHDIFSPLEPWTIRIVNIAKEFAKRGHYVKLVYFPLGEANPSSRGAFHDVEIIPLKRKCDPFTLLVNCLKICKLANWADIIHFQKCFHYASLPALLAGLLRNIPIHYDWDDWETQIYYHSTQRCMTTSLIGWFLDTLERLIPKVVETVSVSSNRLKELCLQFGIEKDRIFDAHVGANLEQFHPEISGESVRKRYNVNFPLILYLGQLHGAQYADLFIHTAKEVLNFRPETTFMIVGEGYMAEEFKKLTYILNLNGKVIFTGAVSHDLVPQYIAAADVCVACFEENEVTLCKSPLKIVEYLASGKAIVASQVGEVPNMIGEAGILTRPGDVQSLADGIIKMIEDDSLRKNLKRLARQRAEKKYNWTVTAENILNAYGKAIKISRARK